MRWIEESLKALAKTLGVSVDTISEQDLAQLNERLSGVKSSTELAEETRRAIIEQGRSGGSVNVVDREMNQVVQPSTRLRSYLANGKVKIPALDVSEISNSTQKIVNRQVEVKEFKPPEFKG